MANQNAKVYIRDEQTPTRKTASRNDSERICTVAQRHNSSQKLPSSSLASLLAFSFSFWNASWRRCPAAPRKRKKNREERNRTFAENGSSHKFARREVATKSAMNSPSGSPGCITRAGEDTAWHEECGKTARNEEGFLNHGRVHYYYSGAHIESGTSPRATSFLKDESLSWAISTGKCWPVSPWIQPSAQKTGVERKCNRSNAVPDAIVPTWSHYSARNKPPAKRKHTAGSTSIL